jgi:indolepyruvate decarboxylase
LDQALNDAKQYQRAFCLIDVHLDPLDRSPALERLALRLAKRL